jgi:hypothetical protein
MSSAAMSRVFWALFAGLLAAGGYLLLAACDLGIAPLFGLRYCKVAASSRELENEKAHHRALLARLGEAQLRVALLPTCKPPQPKTVEEPPGPLPSSPNTVVEPPGPLPSPPKTAEEHPEPLPAKLEVPKRKEELEGCWQSVRGDVAYHLDTKKHEYAGDARICYCFGKNGKGAVRQMYTAGPQAGSVCETKLTAVLKPNELLLSHPRIPCTKGVAVNPATIVCRSTRDEAASCTMTYHSEFSGKPKQEQFQRVSDEHCQWRPRR